MHMPELFALYTYVPTFAFFGALLGGLAKWVLPSLLGGLLFGRGKQQQQQQTQLAAPIDKPQPEEENIFEPPKAQETQEKGIGKAKRTSLKMKKQSDYQTGLGTQAGVTTPGGRKATGPTIV